MIEALLASYSIFPGKVYVPFFFSLLVDSFIDRKLMKERSNVQCPYSIQTRVHTPVLGLMGVCKGFSDGHCFAPGRVGIGHIGSTRGDDQYGNNDGSMTSWNPHFHRRKSLGLPLGCPRLACFMKATFFGKLCYSLKCRVKLGFHIGKELMGFKDKIVLIIFEARILTS